MRELKIELVDRHAEHVDQSLELCGHAEHSLRVGDNLHVDVAMDAPAWIWTSKLVEAKAEVEVHYLARDHIRVIINQADYLAVRRAQEAEARQSNEGGSNRGRRKDH